MQNKQLKPNDLVNIESFKGWLKNNLKNLYTQKEIPFEHLLIYLDYIRKKVLESSEVDRIFWLKLIRDAEENIKSLKRVEK